MIDILAQADSLRTGIEYGILGLILVGGGSWLGVRFFGKQDGIFTSMMASVEVCNATNSETLRSLKETAAKQQASCEKHAAAMGTMIATTAGLNEMADTLDEWHENPEKPVAAHKVRMGLLQACRSFAPRAKEAGLDLDAEISAIVAKLE